TACAGATGLGGSPVACSTFAADRRWRPLRTSSPLSVDLDHVVELATPRTLDDRLGRYADTQDHLRAARFRGEHADEVAQLRHLEDLVQERGRVAERGRVQQHGLE